MLLVMDSLRGIKLIADKIVYIVDICQAPGCEFWIGYIEHKI